ncbi:glycoside hydrolase family 17 protein [Hypoxylon sp. FL1284]|nr:glycoside hydrolase family 17 protein [Hypoxylon sp. FL1284]
MKATFTVAVALAGAASAGSIHHRHAHDAYRALEKKTFDNGTCGCTTIYSTYYGEATLSFPPVPTSTSAPPPPPPATTTSTAVVVPTPVPQTCSTTGVYTFPATTITLTDSTTVCVPSTTGVPSGTHTVGGVTTAVTTATTVTCPYATVSTSAGVTTSVIATTTYVCPSAGTYTIAPTTTTVDQDTTITVPAVTTYPAGTYTQPELITTIDTTSTVVYCPFDIPSPTPAKPSTTAVPSPSSYPAVPATTVAPKPSAQPSAPAPKPKPKPSGGLGGAAGKPWGISYTPYGTGPSAGCKSASQVEADIAAIAAAGVTTVRVYSTDCDTLPNVGSACAKHGLKMILGLFIDSPGCDASNPSVNEQINAIKAWSRWDLVSLVAVGNEAVFHGYCEPSELASLVTKCKSEFSGYNGPFTTAETVNIWQQSDFSSAMCGVVDVAGANAHAFFNTETDASQAGQFVKGQLDIVSDICKGVPGIILETGWPTAGNAMGQAVPGVHQQGQAISSIVKECGDKAVLFSLTSDKWKSADTACACEQHFGVAGSLNIHLSL